MAAKGKQRSVAYLGFCPKSPTGKHKWQVQDGRSTCAYCGAFTTQQLLLDGKTVGTDR